MRVESLAISEANQEQLGEHKRKWEFLSENIPQVQTVLQKLIDFQVAIPSWAVGTGGTRFGRFPGGGEPRTTYEKIDDIAALHAVTGANPSVSLHVPWDDPGDDAPALRRHAEERGIGFDAMNSNTFHDNSS